MNWMEVSLLLKSKKVIVFGTGEGAFRVTKILTILDIPIEYYVDNNIEKQGHEYLGSMVYSPDIINTESAVDIFIVVASMYYMDISRQLAAMGLEETVAYMDMQRLPEEQEFEEYMRKAVEVCSIIDKFAPVSMSYKNDKIIEAIKKVYNSEQDIDEIVLDVLCEDNKIFLRNGTIKFTDRKSLKILFNELLINEDYYFVTDTDRPRILDCGTNFGLALYYFKSLYPGAEIIGFEPVGSIRDLALDNIKNNEWNNVEILPFAIDACEGTASFWLPKSDSMAGSLTERKRLMGGEVVEIRVQCVPLSRYLTKPVNYLKLDIEGSELDALVEAQEHLHMVEHIFCEVHRGIGIENNRLSKVLSLLEDHDFVCQVSKSYCNSNATKIRTMEKITWNGSTIIWGKNTNFNCNARG